MLREMTQLESDLPENPSGNIKHRHCRRTWRCRRQKAQPPPPLQILFLSPISLFRVYLSFPLCEPADKPRLRRRRVRRL
ncbi:hypothetical protein HanIR_Chr07g0324771 [Helianthus annuus]|nr:hypothetical protein HanIR_Chr07g0324771 [Helianthus annuus]